MMDSANLTMFTITPLASNSSNTVINTQYVTTCKIDDAALRIPLLVFYLLFFLFGLVGNVLALWVFLRMHSKKNSVRIFLINVALADLLLVACLPFRVLYHAKNRWDLGPLMCRVVGNAFYMNMYISITLLGFISVDRYMKLHRSARRKRFVRGRWSQRACAIVWTLAIIFLVILVSISGHGDMDISRQEDMGVPRCFHYRQFNSVGLACFKYFLVILFWLVYATLVISYLQIGKMLQRTSRDRPDLPNAQKFSQTARKSFFVLFLFTLCFVPYHVVRIFYVATQINQRTPCAWQDAADKANEVALLLSAFNSCLDPVMYFLLCSSMRRTTMDILRKLVRMPDVPVSSVSSSELGKSQRQSLSNIHTQNERMLVQVAMPGGN